MTTSPTPPHDLRSNDDAGIAGTIHECDPAAVARLKALMAQQQPPRWQEARRRQYNGSQIVANLQRSAITHADRVRLVLSDEQMTDVEQRRANGETWAGIARAMGLVHTTLMLAYARQTHAGQQAAKQQEKPQ
jgi:hypothetical protein